MDVLLVPLLQVFGLAISIYIQLIVVSVIFSWLLAFNIINPRNQFVHMVGDFLGRITDPVYRRIRRYIPPMGSLDISPLILILGLIFLRGVLERILLHFS